MLNPDVVIYHNPCPDGMLAAWVFHRYAIQNDLVEPHFFPTSYDDNPIDINYVKDKQVVIVDFSYSREYTEKIKAAANSLIVLDHHHTSQKNLEGLDYAVFDNKRSGCQLSWDYVYPGKSRPWYVDYVADRDLWNWKLPMSREINKALYMKNMLKDFSTIDDLVFVSVDTISYEGKIFCECENSYLNKMAASKKSYYFKSSTPTPKIYKVIAIEATINISELGAKLAEENPDHDFVLLYRHDIDKNCWYISCRARQDSELHLGEILRGYGGGGHAKAAGFTHNHDLDTILHKIK